MEATWVVVADSTKARVYEATTSGAWKEVVEFANFTGERGRIRSQPFAGGGASHARPGEASASAWRQGYTEFARHIARFLERERGLGRFSSLRLVGTPPFLSHLQSTLSPAVSACIEGVASRNILRFEGLDLASLVEGARHKEMTAQSVETR